MARDVASDKMCLDAFDHCWDIPWSRSPLDPRNLLHAPSLIQNIVKREGYDIVHVHTPVAAFVTRFALRNRGVDTLPKIVYTAHGFHFYKGGQVLRNCIFLNLEKLAGKWTDKLIVINQEDDDAAALHRIVPQEDRVYMPGIGLDFSTYSKNNVSQEDILAIRKELQLEESDALFSMVAEFIPRKRHWDLIRAVSLLQDPSIHIAFAGTGATLDAMKQLSKDLNIAKQFHFLGHRKDIPAIMCASTATILTSGQEGLARCVMESICQRIPVIGANARGIRELISPERGILYPVGDIPALVDALKTVLNGNYATITPDTRWDINYLIRQHDSLYAGLLLKKNN